MLIPRNHARKIWPRFVGAILRGEKAFELRQEDRARFEPGDVLELLEWCPQVEKYSGVVLRFGVSSVLRDVPGLVEGFAVLVPGSVRLGTLVPAGRLHSERACPVRDPGRGSAAGPVLLRDGKAGRMSL